MERLPIQGKFSAMVECEYCQGSGAIDFFDSNAAAHKTCPRCRGEGGYLHVFEYKPFRGKKEIRSARSHLGISHAKRASAYNP